MKSHVDPSCEFAFAWESIWPGLYMYIWNVNLMATFIGGSLPYVKHFIKFIVTTCTCTCFTNFVWN